MLKNNNVCTVDVKSVFPVQMTVCSRAKGTEKDTKYVSNKFTQFRCKTTK